MQTDSQKNIDGDQSETKEDNEDMDSYQ